jgi:integrase
MSTEVITTAGTVSRITGQESVLARVEQEQSERVLAKWYAMKGESTQKTYRQAFLKWAEFWKGLDTKVSAEKLLVDVDEWRQCRPIRATLEAYKDFLLVNGHAVSTTNQYVGVCKKYAELLTLTDVMTDEDVTRIKTVPLHISAPDSEAIDQERAKMDIPNRLSNKKTEANVLTIDQVLEMKAFMPTWSDDPFVAARDYAMFVLMVDHGLRASEVVGLDVDDVEVIENPETEESQAFLNVYRRKTRRQERLVLSKNSKQALVNWFYVRERRLRSEGPLFRSARRQTGDGHMLASSVTKVMRQYGVEILGLDNLSCHDLRHTWATHMADLGVSAPKLMRAGSWESMESARRYIHATKVTNAGLPQMPSLSKGDNEHGRGDQRDNSDV